MPKKKDLIFKSLGSSNHCDEERAENDFYATPSYAVDLLLNEEKFSHNILEPACGMGHISKVLIEAGYDVESNDLIDRRFGTGGIDFLNRKEKWNGDIITNPPYDIGLPFIQKAIEIIPKGNKVAMFLKLLFLESKKRKEFFLENPPKTIYVSSSRILCLKNGDNSKKESSAVCYAWFVWEKGFKGNPIIKWIN